MYTFEKCVILSELCSSAPLGIKPFELEGVLKVIWLKQG